MNINEFMQQVQPRKKRSRLIPFTDQIHTLKKKGYTDLQICDWLAKNNIIVSRQTVQYFIKNITKKNDNEKNINDNIENKIEKTELSQAQKIQQNLENQKRDADKKLFKHDKTGNT